MSVVNGKVAIVTGGAMGIGLNCVRELLKNGARGVTIADINETSGKEALREFQKHDVIFLKADVTVNEEFDNIFKKTIEKWGTVDIVLNNAGIFNEVNWNLCIAVNCGSVVRGTYMGNEHMSKEKNGNGGIIVNIGSIYGLEAAISCPIYTASKNFVVAFSRSIGTEEYLNRTGIKVLTLCPGVTTTSILDAVTKNAAININPNMAKITEEGLQKLPIQTTEYVAEAFIELLEKPTGSVGVVEGKEPLYLVQIPERCDLPKICK